MNCLERDAAGMTSKTDLSEMNDASCAADPNKVDRCFRLTRGDSAGCWNTTLIHRRDALIAACNGDAAACHAACSQFYQDRTTISRICTGAIGGTFCQEPKNDGTTFATQTDSDVGFCDPPSPPPSPPPPSPPPPSPPPPSPPPGVFFHLNDTNATQEDVIYANEYHEALEYEGPVLWPGDLAIWARTPP